MIYEQLPNLKGYKLILASGSSRRKELLAQVGAEVEIIPSTFPETLDKSSFDLPELYCLENAHQKALEVYNRVKGDYNVPFIVIGCDTIIENEGKILEKPSDKQNAVETLTKLQGNEHNVFSGLALITVSNTTLENKHPKIDLKFSKTQVTFDSLSPTEIESYVLTGEPMDKAGSYGIQGLSSLFIKEIKGDYYNVVGFPLNLFYKMLKVIV